MYVTLYTGSQMAPPWQFGELAAQGLGAQVLLPALDALAYHHNICAAEKTEIEQYCRIAGLELPDWNRIGFDYAQVKDKYEGLLGSHPLKSRGEAEKTK